MKKTVGILLAVLGLLLSAAGVAGIVLIGSDNTIESPSSTLKIGDAKAVVSTPGLLAYTDTTMRITAESSGGSVFVGQAHPVDVTSYLDGAPTYAVTSVGTSGVSGEAVEGDAKAAPPDPTKQTFWTESTSGAGSQTLQLALDGKPTTYVVMPLGKPGDITMSSGVVIPGGFGLAIGALILGVLLLIGGIVLARRRRTPSGPDDAAVNRPAADAPAGRAPTGADEPAGARTLSRAVTVSVLALTVPALAGCGVVPQKVEPWKNSEVTKPSMTPDQADLVLKDLATRRNAIAKATATSNDARPWRDVSSGPLYTTEVLQSQYRQMTKTSEKSVVSLVGTKSYIPAFSGYPMYALVAGTEAYDKGKPIEVLNVVQRTSVIAPWTMLAAAHVPAKSLPASAAPGGASTPGPEQQKQALAAANAVMARINTGKGGPALPKELESFLSDMRTTEGASSLVRAQLWPSDAEPLEPGGPVQAVATPTGSLVLASYDLLNTQTANPGKVFRDNPESSYRKATQQTGNQEIVRYRLAVMVAMTVDKQGKPTVIGFDQVPVR
ncbi:hypothetical protein BCF74_10118 [Knoellia remsis]|uniref:Uncharacterized protein n=1 Tax=Knoellia remsis TaxID=407159 RepID=A0A2T0V0B4_9MICO|nr:hypothetical protein [Knoellia remsis]PRY63620.1 hypothetical protein BCF74_10118 [Knoellia remsis]